MQLFYVCRKIIGEGNDNGMIISAKDREGAEWLWRSIFSAGDQCELLVFRIPQVSPVPMVHEWHVAWDKRGCELVSK